MVRNVLQTFHLLLCLPWRLGAAFLAWIINQAPPVQALTSTLIKTSLEAASSGLLLAGTISGLDAILNASGGVDGFELSFVDLSAWWAAASAACSDNSSPTGSRA